ERLHEADDLAVVEHRDGDAQVRQVADAALGLVDVVVEEDVTGPHGLQREVAHDRVDQGAVGAAGQLAQLAVVDPRAEVVRVADHRAAGGAGDGCLHLHLDRGQGALDDLDHDRVDGGGGGGGAHACSSCCCAPASAPGLVITRLPQASTLTA